MSKSMSAKMKPSGIKWIGDIPAEWNIGRVKYFYDIVLGKMLQPEQENPSDKEMYYMCSANVTWKGIDTTVLKQMWFSPSEIKKYLLKCGDLLVAEGGDVAIASIWKDEVHECCIQNALHLVRENGKYLNQYLYYCLYYLKQSDYIDLICNKATIAHFTKEKFGDVPICTIPLSEQQTIASFLDSQCGKIDSIIAEMEQQIEILKQYKTSLITETVTKGLDKTTPMKDSDIEWIGRIPAHWEKTKLKYICTMQSGDNLTSEDISDYGEYPVFGGNGQRGFYYKYNSDDEIILVGRQGALCGNVHRINEKIWATDHAVVTRAYNNKCKVGYLYYLLISMNLNQYSISAAQPGLAVANIQNLSTYVPKNIEEQKEISDFLDAKIEKIADLIAEKHQSISTMKSYKKSLIYEYVTGKKRVTI
jgi:type I restriction enzyme S subunit